ncbi:MAG: NB-ARC domain-containing protein, partial [Chloroflexia bacterium]
MAEALDIPAEDRVAWLQFARSLGIAAPPILAAPTPYVLSKSQPHRPSTNLPTQPTAFVGRNGDIVALASMLMRQTEPVRLVTLTGPGGIGKTRLGIRVAEHILDSYDDTFGHVFADGIYFVSLGHVADPSMVLSTILQALPSQEVPGQPAIVTLTNWLRDKSVLLVLDNYEHLIQAAQVVSDLLTASQKLKVLITSREVLHLRGEQAISVSPLTLPDLRQLPPMSQLPQYEAVYLFIQRARNAKFDFTVSEENASAVAEICHMLDGLPLAIELAAARIKIMSPHQILARFNSRLTLLTGGAMDLPARQKTLRSTIEWSYGLLDDREKKLFRRLGIFSGGCTLEAAESVCIDYGMATSNDLRSSDGGYLRNLLDILTSLVDKSLLREESGLEGQPRFWMLETLREYALEKLLESNGTEATLGRFSDYFLRLAEEGEQWMPTMDQSMWLNRLECEHSNLQAVLDWMLNRGEAELACLLISRLWYFWWLRDHTNDARIWLEKTLESGMAAVGTVPRARALQGVGFFNYIVGDYSTARRQLEESVSILKQASGGNEKYCAVAMNNLAVVLAAQGESPGGTIE